MIKIDGSYLEGGGQIVRTAVALSSCLKIPVTITNIRKGRKVPGLKNQHLHLIKALQELCDADVEGLSLGSSKIIFKPKCLKSKNLNIDIGTAGSISLLLQGLLLPCAFLKKPIIVRIMGGTSVKWSMPVEFLSNVLAPHLTPFFASLKIRLINRGYYPKGGGKVELKIKPAFNKVVFDKTNQGNLVLIKGISHASKSLELARVSERQTESAKHVLKKYGLPINIFKEYSKTSSPGSGIVLWAVFENTKGDREVILGSDALGEKDKTSELVGEQAAENLVKEIDSQACVDEYTCDNLIPWMAFVGGRIKTSKVTNHTLTNIYTVEKITGAKFSVKKNIICLSRPI